MHYDGEVNKSAAISQVDVRKITKLPFAFSRKKSLVNEYRLVLSELTKTDRKGLELRMPWNYRGMLSFICKSYTYRPVRAGMVRD